MTAPSQYKYNNLYHCEQHGHYHLISGPENVSWPFWSLEGALKVIDHAMQRCLDEPKKDRKERLGELVAIRKRLFEQFRSEQPSLHRHYLPGERTAPELWTRFRNGEIRYMGIFARYPACGTLFLPLYCDFVGRDGQIKLTEPNTRSGWAELAAAPARVVTMQELHLVP